MLVRLGQGAVELLVERHLADCERVRARARDATGKLEGRLAELITWHDVVDESPVGRSPGVDQLAREQHLERPLAAHGTRDLDHGRRAEQADPDAGSRESGILARDREIAGSDELAPGCCGRSVHLRDHGLR